MTLTEILGKIGHFLFLQEYKKEIANKTYNDYFQSNIVSTVIDYLSKIYQFTNTTLKNIVEWFGCQ
jgi:hypothetical protein